MPAIILLIGIGLIVGPGLNFLEPEQLFGEFLHPFVELSVSIILFEGGLNLKWQELNEVSFGIKRLISLGLILNFLLGSCAAHYILHVPWEISCLLGAMLVVTGPTVILPLLRQAHLNKKINSYLKWEGIINDPLGVLLTTFCYQFVLYYDSTIAFSMVLISLLKTVFLSCTIALGTAVCLKNFFNRLMVPDYIKVPILLSSILIIYIISTIIQNGSGLLAVTILGIYLGNSDINIVKDLRKFKESISLLALSIVFVVLSANIEFEMLKTLHFKNIVYILAISFLIRPVAIYLSTLGSDINYRERTLIGFFAPRGIVAASMAGIISLRLSHQGYENVEFILPTIFLIIITTVIVHSFSLKPFAGLLGLQVKSKNGIIMVGCSEWTIALSKLLQDLKIPVLITDNVHHRLLKARKQDLAVHYGDVITEIEEDEIDLNVYDTIFAFSENESYNNLVAESVTEDFNRSDIFQLPVSENLKSADENLSKLKNLIVNPELNFTIIEEKFCNHWVFKKTKISSEFTYEDYKAKYKDISLHLMYIKANNGFKYYFINEDSKKSSTNLNNEAQVPAAGDIVISLINEKALEDDIVAKKKIKKEKSLKITNDLVKKKMDKSIVKTPADDI
jgi:NhaP-type Na+/H+ or K+/H+ antiporter